MHSVRPCRSVHPADDQTKSQSREAATEPSTNLECIPGNELISALRCPIRYPLSQTRQPETGVALSEFHFICDNRSRAGVAGASSALRLHASHPSRAWPIKRGLSIRVTTVTSYKGANYAGGERLHADLQVKLVSHPASN